MASDERTQLTLRHLPHRFLIVEWFERIDWQLWDSRLQFRFLPPHQVQTQGPENKYPLLSNDTRTGDLAFRSQTNKSFVPNRSVSEAPLLDWLMHSLNRYSKTLSTDIKCHSRLFPEPIHEALRATNSSAAFLAGKRAILTKVNISLGDMSLVQPFEYREFGTEKNFVHRSGLRITMDRATRMLSDGHHHHALESEIFKPRRPAVLAGAVFNFFRLFRPGATIELQAGWEAPLETFGETLTSLGSAVSAWPDLSKALKLPTQRLCVGDLQDQEFSRTAWLLEALLIRNVPIGTLANGFLIGPAADQPLDQLSVDTVLAKVPLVLNWKDIGIVVWLECEAEAYLFDDKICGFRLTKQISWRIQKTHRFDKSIYPEVWLFRDWPAIPIREGLSGTSDWTYDGTSKRSFEAKISTTKAQ